MDRLQLWIKLLHNNISGKLERDARKRTRKQPSVIARQLFKNCLLLKVNQVIGWHRCVYLPNEKICWKRRRWDDCLESVRSRVRTPLWHALKFQRNKVSVPCSLVKKINIVGSLRDREGPNFVTGVWRACSVISFISPSLGGYSGPIYSICKQPIHLFFQ